MRIPYLTMAILSLYSWSAFSLARPTSENKTIAKDISVFGFELLEIENEISNLGFISSNESCLQTLDRKIIRNDSELKNFVDQFNQCRNNGKNISFPKVNFASKDILILIAQTIDDFDRKVLLDKGKKRIIYTIRPTYREGRAYMGPGIRSLNAISIAKLPSTFAVEFKLLKEMRQKSKIKILE